MEFMNKLRLSYNFIIIFLTLTIAATACRQKENKQITVEEYMTVTEADISTCIKMVFLKEQIAALKTNAERHKKIIENLKGTFAVACAALEAGYEKEVEFQNDFSHYVGGGVKTASLFFLLAPCSY